uniref:Uncharacterized protein n=1 Tax=Anguilla anguilla TaxID=7936 RepID=A0A0E9XKW3_ANGAN
MYSVGNRNSTWRQNHTHTHTHANTHSRLFFNF